MVVDGWNPPMKMVESIQVLKEKKKWTQEKKEENHKNKKGNGCSSSLNVKRKVRKGVTLYLRKGNLADFRESL